LVISTANDLGNYPGFAAKKDRYRKLARNRSGAFEGKQGTAPRLHRSRIRLERKVVAGVTVKDRHGNILAAPDLSQREHLTPQEHAARNRAITARRCLMATDLSVNSVAWYRANKPDALANVP
jgi:hypothetical protein